jgi:cysteine desulfurase/selenocysteine lyase
MSEEGVMEHGRERTWEAIRGDFPILNQQINGHPLAYLDSAASSQLPRPVIDAMVRYHETMHANVHRGVHTLSQRATSALEQTREALAQFIGAAEPRECVFVRGATEGINLIAHTFGSARVGAGDEVLVSAMEHHANLVPWQMLCERVGARLSVVPMTDTGELDLDEYRRLLNRRVKMVALVHVSNSLGTINPIKEMIAEAHERDIPVLIDGCQAAPHMKLDMRDLDADFYTFSAHKMCGPTGIGVMYGKAAHWEAMGPWQGGGDMIRSVSFERTTYAEPPHRFEAGTPAIMAGVVWAEALRYLESIGLDRIAAREHELAAAARSAMAELGGVRFFGQARQRAALISFDLEGIHPNDIGIILDSQGVAVRTGQHCTEPVMTRLGIHSTARASFAFYNNQQDIDRLIEGLRLVKELCG